MEGQVVLTSGSTKLMNSGSSMVIDLNNLTDCKAKSLPISGMFGSGIFSEVDRNFEFDPMVCGGCIEDCSKDGLQDVDVEKLNANSISKDCVRLKQNGSWITGPKMKERRIKFSLTWLSNNSIIAIGGLNEKQKRGTKGVEIFDQMKWTSAVDTPVQIHSHCAIADKDDNIFVLGGVHNGQV